MAVIVFDVELTGNDGDDVWSTVIVHHDSFQQLCFPIMHILNVAFDELGWSKPWIELRNQETGEPMVLIQYEKDSKGLWIKQSVTGEIPERLCRVDLYLLDHRPNRSLDAFL